jgi:hypothetical protein
MIYIDAEKIYDATHQGLTIFQHYFPGVDFGDQKHFVKCRTEEKTASAKVSLYKGKWRITDFGNQSEMSGMSSIAYVMWAENLIYIDALRFIQEVIVRHEVGGKEFVRPKYRADYSWRDLEPEDKKGEYKFAYKPVPTDNDLKSIGRYVTAGLLDRFNFKSVEKYEMVSYSEKYKKDIVNIFKSTDDYPIFVMDEGKFKKIYKPHEFEKKHRFGYAGTKPTNYVFGLKQLQTLDNEFVNPDTGEYEYNGPEWKKPKVKDLIRCSGESDAMNVASLGYHVYWLNSESAEMDRESWETLDGMCDKHYQLMDLDATGKDMAMKFAHRHIDLVTIELPDWLKLKKDWRGNPCKDIKDFIAISGTDVDETTTNFVALKHKAFPIKFWTRTIEDSKGKKVVNYNVNLENYYYFLRSHGFYVTDSPYHRKAGYCYAHIDGKVVDLINPENIKKIIKRFTKDWIRSKNLLDEVAILNKINSSNQISESNLQDIGEITLNFTNHDKRTEYLHFRNGSLKIQRDTIEKVKHHEIPNYILGKLELGTDVVSHVIDKSINLVKQPIIEIKPTSAYALLLDKLKGAKTSEERENTNVELASYPELDRYEVTINDTEFIFARFLKDLSHIHWRKELEEKQPLTPDEKKEQNLLLANLMFVLGYMTSQYKDPGKPWLVFLQDMKISQIGQSSGRSGKSLLCAALSHSRPRFYIGARRKDITDKTEFLYDGFTKFHNIIEVDDLYEFADFNFFYTQVTGNREINSKHISKQILPYDSSGKMVVSSNFELQNVDSSTIARILNGAASDYYHEKTKFNDYKESRSPFTKFGRLLFDDFTEEEWVKFYNLMAYCIQLQMRFFKIQPPMDNLMKRQLRRLMTRGVSKDEEFFTWANHYFVIPPDPRPDISPDNVGYFNVYFKREAAFDNFKTTLSSSQSSKYKSNQFKSSLGAWCEYYGYTLNPIHLCTGTNAAEDRRIIKKIDLKTTECFFISTLNIQTDQSDDQAPTKEDLESVPF